MFHNFDFAIVGGGIVGLAIGIEILEANPKAKVVILDKEDRLGMHASGRNSGVIHAGFYYSPDSLKARLTRDGNKLLKDFAERRHIKVVNCGKVVVTRSSDDLEALEELEQRAMNNGVVAEIVSVAKLAALEPLAKTTEAALWSQSTAVANPQDFVEAFAEHFQDLGGQILLNIKVERLENGKLTTNLGVFVAQHIVNAAGGYADKLARHLGFARNYVLIPFMGLYWYAPSLKGSLKTHIYPTPDARNPFLGVHLTRTVDGSVKIGPTAIPVLSREQYSVFSGFKFNEFLEIASTLPKFSLSKHHDVPGLLATEIPKLSRNFLAQQAAELTNGLRPELFTNRGKPGIRAQLLNTSENKLEMDFVIQGDSESTHILNAVSPAWTSSISFAKHVLVVMRGNNVDV